MSGKASAPGALPQNQSSWVDYADGEFVLHTNAGELRAEPSLIATGRTANTERLNLKQISMKTVRGAIQSCSGLMIPDTNLGGNFATLGEEIDGETLTYILG